MPETRHGEQLPTHSVVMPYEKTLGGEAVKLYNKSRRKAMPWQEQQIYDIMAVDDNGLWLHMKYGYSVPRRNGKSEILVMRIVWGLQHGEKILYTAHRTSTSSDMWARVVEAITACGFVEKQDFKTIKSHGFEKIEMLVCQPKSCKTDKSGGSLSTRTRSSKSGLGEGFDLLIIDEAQEYTADQQSALQYLVTSSQNPQTIMCGTPPTAVSAGTVFPKYRRKTLSGENSSAGWAEWSLPKMSDGANFVRASDRDLWYKTNPSLGYTLTERNIADEDFDDAVDANIQRLGVWILYKQNSAVTLEEWNRCKSDKPALKSPVQLFFGISYAKASQNISIAVACRTEDGRVFVEGIDCYPSRAGVGAILPYLRSKRCGGVVIDGASGYAILTDEMKNAGIKKPPVIPKVAEVIAANALFEQQIFAGLIAHAGQPALVQAVTNCEHRPIGGGFGYTSLMEEADVGLVEAVSLAHWLCFNTKEKKVQKCYYY